MLLHVLATAAPPQPAGVVSRGHVCACSIAANHINGFILDPQRPIWTPLQLLKFGGIHVGTEVETFKAGCVSKALNMHALEWFYNYLFIHQHRLRALEIISEDVSRGSLRFSSRSTPIRSCACVFSSHLPSDFICQRHAALWVYSSTLQAPQHPSMHSLLCRWQKERVSRKDAPTSL